MNNNPLLFSTENKQLFDTINEILPQILDELSITFTIHNNTIIIDPGVSDQQCAEIGTRLRQELINKGFSDFTNILSIFDV